MPHFYYILYASFFYPSAELVLTTSYVPHIYTILCASAMGHAVALHYTPEGRGFDSFFSMP